MDDDAHNNWKSSIQADYAKERYTLLPEEMSFMFMKIMDEISA